MMGRKSKNSYYARLYEKQMKGTAMLPTDISKKVEFYKKLGRFEGRLIFKAGIPALIQPSKHKPFGWLALYDDMTKDDAAAFCGIYKEERKRYLEQTGKNKRKYITSKSYRNLGWYRIAKRFNWNYKKAAVYYRYKYGEEVRKMLLKYIWDEPTRIHSLKLRDFVDKAKSDKLTLKDFKSNYHAQLSKEIITKDLNNYVKVCLPVSMSAAVNRLKKTL